MPSSLQHWENTVAPLIGKSTLGNGAPTAALNSLGTVIFDALPCANALLGRRQNTCGSSTRTQRRTFQEPAPPPHSVRFRRHGRWGGVPCCPSGPPGCEIERHCLPAFSANRWRNSISRRARPRHLTFPSQATMRAYGRIDSKARRPPHARDAEPPGQGQCCCRPRWWTR